MRKLPYITLGRILLELKEEGTPISRPSFYRLERRLNLPAGKRTSSKHHWRVYSRVEADEVKKKIKEEYSF